MIVIQLVSTHEISWFEYTPIHSFLSDHLSQSKIENLFNKNIYLQRISTTKKSAAKITENQTHTYAPNYPQT